MTRPSRDETMMAIARAIAERSTCVRRKVGAVAVDSHGRVMAMGHNGVAMGELHCTEVACAGANLPSGQGLDVCEAEHAERSLLSFCHDITKIDVVYVTASPCTGCVRGLLNTGAKRLVYAELYDKVALDRWHRSGRISEKLNVRVISEIIHEKSAEILKKARAIRSLNVEVTIDRK